MEPECIFNSIHVRSSLRASFTLSMETEKNQNRSTWYISPCMFLTNASMIRMLVAYQMFFLPKIIDWCGRFRFLTVIQYVSHESWEIQSSTWLVLRCASIQLYRIWHLSPLSLECKSLCGATVAGTFLGLAHADPIATTIQLYKLSLFEWIGRSYWAIAQCERALKVRSHPEYAAVKGDLFSESVDACDCVVLAAKNQFANDVAFAFTFDQCE